jgi:hypothetical protein
MSGDIKKEATKYMKIILDFDESPFLPLSRIQLPKRSLELPEWVWKNKTV